MAIASNAFDDEGTGSIERGRGGFMRGYNDVPYITDPDGGTVKSGPRKGLPKRIPYGSPSGAGKLIENTYNLQKWGERRVVLGIGLAFADGDFELLRWCFDLAALDVDSDKYKELADHVIVRCKDIAESNLAAERGTHGHAILEDDDEGRDWIARAEAGELLGIPTDVQQRLVEAWRHMLAVNQLEVLVSEASCVDDLWRLAGTLDNLARLGKSLRFRLCTGEVVTVPAGTVVVLDKKTGQRRTKVRSGAIEYWHGYAVQIASYAQSKPYDTETETRGEWAWEIDPRHALIAHIDIVAAIAGAPVEEICQLVYVDLVAGREHGGATVVRAKEWAKRDDVFSVAQLDSDADGIDTADRAQGSSTLEEQRPLVSTSSGSGTSGGEPASPAHDLQIAGEGATTPSPAHEVTDGAVGESDTPPVTAPTSVEPTPSARPMSPLRQAQQARATIDATADARRDARLAFEGPTLDTPDWTDSWALLEERFKRQTRPQLNWTGQLVRDAREAGYEFNVGGGKTARRFELYRAVIHLAALQWPNDTDRDDTTRLFASLAAGFADLQIGPLGALVGGLNHEQAKAFADMACAYEPDLAAPAA